LGHDNFGFDAKALAVVRHGLAMVSRRGGDDPPGSVRKGEAQEFMKSAAFFKRTGHLEVFKLEKRLTAAELAQLLRVDQGRAEDLVVDGEIGFFDIELGDQFNPLKTFTTEATEHTENNEFKRIFQGNIFFAV
jgi:hypothetical protein